VSRYKLLAGAVAGHTVVVAGGAEERSWSDGETIYLVEDEGYPQRDSLVVQAALLAIGSFDTKVVAKTTGRRALRLRYLTLEALRAAHELEEALPGPVARRIRAVYDAEPPASAEESFKRANSSEDVPEAPEWLGTIKPSKVLLNTASTGGSAPTRKQQEQGASDDGLREIDDEEESETSKIMDLFSAPFGKNPISDAIQKFLGAGRSPKEDSSGGDEMSTGGSRIGRVGKNAAQIEASDDLDFGFFGPPVGRLYPEWDWQKKRYKPDYCSVYEYDPRMEEQPTELDPGLDARLRRELARLGLAHERHRRQDDGDALDVTALIEYVVDRATGSAGDDRVYELKRRTAHDLGVVVLLDVTGSTGDSDEGRRVFDDQRQVAARLIATLDELGDRVAGYGFQSWGRNGVRFLRIKEFDDRYDLAAQKRLAAMEPGGFTRLGAAIRHGTHLVTEKSGTINTLLIVVGDGLPYDDGYEHRYAQEDSHKALSEAVDRGVACACISVKTATEEDVIERVWGHVPHIKLDRVSDLSREVLPVFRRSLREAVLAGRDGRR
jgi:nitric oxide reductase activation protein